MPPGRPFRPGQSGNPGGRPKGTTWAMRERLWVPQPSSLIDQFADLLARAIREEYITDRCRY